MRLLALVAGLLVSSPALAGGLGPLVMGGFHTEKVFYYSTTPDGEPGTPFENPASYVQYDQTQLIGNVGAGLELVLGDRDDLIQGVFRGYWMMDAAQRDPASAGLVDKSVLVANWRENADQIGVGTVGMLFGVKRAANDRFKLSLGAHVGSGFATRDHREFLLVQGGLNISYLLSRTLEYYFDVSYGLRVRKDFSHGLYGTTGIRVMFD